MQKCATIWVQMKLTIKEYSLTTSAQLDNRIQKGRTLHLVLRLRGETERQDARHQWHRDHQAQRTWTSTRELIHAWSHVRIVQYSGSGRHDLRTTSWLKFELCASLMPSMHAVSVSLRLWALHSIQLPLLLTHLSISHNFLYFFHNFEGSSNTGYFTKNEMDSTDDSYLLTGYEPKNYDLMETYVESVTESLTHPQFSEQRFLEDVDYDDTALEEMLHNAHREHVCHSQREGLSVGQSSSSMSERTGRPVVERTGRLVMASGQVLNFGNAQNRTLSDRQSRTSPNVRRKFRNTNSRLIMRKRWSKIEWKKWFSAGRTSTRSRRTSTTRSTTSSCTVITPKFGFSWSS